MGLACRARGRSISAVADLADDRRVAVVEEGRGAGVHRGDAGHLLVGELEVEDVEVLRHPLPADGLGVGGDLALDEPPQHDLGHRLAVGGADLAEGRVGEQVVAALGERAPGLELDAALTHELLVVLALKKGWVSIWLTAGVTSLWSMRSTSR